MCANNASIILIKQVDQITDSNKTLCTCTQFYTCIQFCTCTQFYTCIQICTCTQNTLLMIGFARMVGVLIAMIHHWRTIMGSKLSENRHFTEDYYWRFYCPNKLEIKLNDLIKIFHVQNYTFTYTYKYNSFVYRSYSLLHQLDWTHAINPLKSNRQRMKSKLIQKQCNIAVISIALAQIDWLIYLMTFDRKTSHYEVQNGCRGTIRRQSYSYSYKYLHA